MERREMRERERERDVFAVLHYTYKGKEMRSGSEGVVAFCCKRSPNSTLKYFALRLLQHI